MPTAPRAQCGIRPRRCRPSPTTRRWSAGADGTSTRCGCGRRAPSTRLRSTTSTPATMSARWPTRRAPRRSRGCSTRATRRRPARSCGCARNTSSPPPRCRTSCAATSCSTATLASLPDHAAIQLNDTHPAIAVAELMRLLVDVHGFGWDEAWDITRRTFNYTNHTLLPEALETWPVALMERLLPRHMQIIYADQLRATSTTLRQQGRRRRERSRRVSLIDESHGRRVRMGHLAFVGAHTVNGVSALHTELMRETVFQRPATRSIPDRIVNKTNGITFRALAAQANPGLTALLVDDGRRRACSTTPSAAAELADARRRRRASASASPRKRARNKVTLAALIARAPRRSRRSATRCSTCRSSASTSTSASSSTCSRRSRSTTRSAPSPSATGCRA